MELEDARRLWQRDEAGPAQRIDASTLRRSRLDRADGAMQRLTRGTIVELLFDTALVVLLGAFIGKHVHEPRFLIPGLAFDAYAIASLVAVARQVAAIANIDFGAPVLEIQQKLEALRISRLWTVQWVVILAPLMWTPLLIIGLRSLFSVDAYAFLGDGYLAASVVFGAVVFGAGALASRRFADGPSQWPALGGLANLVAGRSVREATRSLNAITRFETTDVS